MEAIKTFKKDNMVLEIYTDDELASNPREWDNLGHMICFHNGYDLGDKHDLKQTDFNNWEELKKYIEKEFKPVAMLPLYLYEHSGITMNTTGFSCPWDSGQVGFIYCTEKDLEYMGSPRDKAEEILKAEVEIYNQYITDDVYSFCLTELKTCEHCDHTSKEVIDSCGGYFGSDFKENNLFEDAGIKDINEWKEC